MYATGLLLIRSRMAAQVAEAAQGQTTDFPRVDSPYCFRLLEGGRTRRHHYQPCACENGGRSEARGHRVDQGLTRNSAIQLCDVLLGAVIANWQKEPIGPAKRALQKEVAMHLGWADLKADTMPDERKFNVWTFHDNRRPRKVGTRPVVLRHPLPKPRRPKAS
jgi:hypothetical protein